jgi:hypothetical protein
MAKPQESYKKWLATGRMQRHLAIGVKTFLTLQYEPIRRIVEYFGGEGKQTLTLAKMFKPELHVVFDRAPDSCETLRNLRLPLEVRQEELHQAVEHDFQPDLVVMDFPDLGWRGAQTTYHAPLARVFGRGTHFIVLTDTAGIRFPAQRRKAYAKLLGIAEPTFDEYLRGMSRWFYAEWGYSMRDCFTAGFEGSLSPGETMFVLKPGWEEARIVPHRPAPPTKVPGVSQA